MDIRKVQMSGGSSYIISLPKDWIKERNIKKNDPIGLVIQNDGNILITPNTSGESIQKTWEFEINSTTDRTFFLRCLIGAYISGYTSLKIWAQGRLPPFTMHIIREFTTMAIGQEVVDETDNMVLIKDLLNPSEMPLNKTILRMSVIVVKMHQDAVSALKENDLSLAENIIFRDNDVDRLHWLIGRQSNLILNDLNLSKKMKISTEDAVVLFLASRIIERVGDHATRIASNVKKLSGKKLPENLMIQIEEVNHEAVRLFQSGMDAFFKRDIYSANDIISETKCIESQCKKINTESMKFEASVAVNIVNISDSIKRVADYSADICENVINASVSAKNKM
ncbi:phosphate uptake regulator PhoU [Methanomicrobium antiquum]|uniref:Phosphate uptake regulator PhoU n=1 Tax=Methanomicrobium antiquum TaxID=487686 RepID=A0AAF0FSB8_9EURY|nr:PhoU domain-containing protein [Methanomicrobium antiquum]WFN37697.1 phosphate uptake regulator PhoU [Methanomicrobium antiquum]